MHITHTFACCLSSARLPCSLVGVRILLRLLLLTLPTHHSQTITRLLLFSKLLLSKKKSTKRMMFLWSTDWRSRTCLHVGGKCCQPFVASLGRASTATAYLEKLVEKRHRVMPLGTIDVSPQALRGALLTYQASDCRRSTYCSPNK